MANTTEVSNKRPWSFYMCSLTFSFERMAFYSSKWLLYVFLTATVVSGGLGLDPGEAAKMQANLVAYTYLAPIIGGWVADRYIGAKYLIPLGLVLMGAGFWVAGTATNPSTLNITIILAAIGTGCFKSNLNALTGVLFEDKKQLDSAFSTQYSFVNVGSFIGTTLIGILCYNIFSKNGVDGYLQCFKVTAIVDFVGAAWFLLGWKSLGEAGKKPFKADQKEDKVEEEKEPLTSLEKRRVGAIALVSAFSVIFWMFWYLTYLAVYDYAPKYIHFKIGDFNIPTSWFDSENALLCIILGPLLGAVWYKLSLRPQGDFSLFKKLGIGLIFLGLSFLMLVGAEVQRGIGAPATSKGSLLWIVAFGALLTLGEMVFSPLGNAFISKYAPKRMLATMMAVWVLSVFFASKSYGYVYAWTLTKPFLNVYLGIPIVLAILAIILFLFDKKLAGLVEPRKGEVDPNEEHM